MKDSKEQPFKTPLSAADSPEKLKAFIAEAEARFKALGLKHPDEKDVQDALKAAIRTERSADQT